jgi:hypothetical protein
MATVNKVSCNTSIDAVVMKQARDLKLSPSAILEEALIKAVKSIDVNFSIRHDIHLAKPSTNHFSGTCAYRTRGE